eukprot:8948925-Pyramimonas_sp.AAC.1
MLRCTSRCLLDSWTIGLLDTYGGAIACEAAVVDVLCRAAEAETDNSKRENAHAWIRRCIVRGSEQTHAAHMEL